MFKIPSASLPYILGTLAGALLYFMIQPMLARFILPSYGGGSHIWTACMLFFQLLLVGGYVYGHVLSALPQIRHQVIVHGCLILLAFSQFPLDPVIPEQIDSPVFEILMFLTSSIGLPGILLSSTAVLLPTWFFDELPAHSPYPLYAVSNAGSLTALISFPVLVEPLVDRSVQLSVWSGLFVAYVSVLIYCLYRRWQLAPTPASAQSQSDNTALSMFWFLWPALGVALMLTVTERLTSNVLVVPLFWVLPFAVYLLSYIVSFASDNWYSRRFNLIAMLAAACLLGITDQYTGIWLQLTTLMVLLFASCMVCHGEVARLKPPGQGLSLYFLCLASGGALGGLAISIGAPAVFDFNLDLEITLILLVGIGLTLVRAEPAETFRWFLGGLSLATLAFIGLNIVKEASSEQVVERSRTFYGALEVRHLDKGTKHERLLLLNDSSPHGVQFINEDRALIGTGYYSSDSAAAKILADTRRRGIKQRHIALVGLGVGTLATFAGDRDQWRIYELNPEVTRLAEQHFSYLASSKATITHIPGDARRSLAAEPDQNFDVIVLDAFSGDSIPLHLLTIEAFELYLRHLKDNGQIVVLTDTWHVDFSAAMHAIGRQLGLATLGVYTEPGNDENWGAEWFVFARDERHLTRLKSDEDLNDRIDETFPAPTDERASIWSMLRLSPGDD